MPRKSNCSYCGSICYSKSIQPRCFNCKKLQTKTNRKDYARNWTLQKKYGISSEDFDVLWITFKGKCGICEVDLEMPKSTRGQTLNTVCVDHNHKTGNIRGLLCNACNKALGLFKDNRDILYKAKEYLS